MVSKEARTMSGNAWVLLIRPLFANIVLAYVALVALLFMSKMVWQAGSAVFTMGRHPVRAASLLVKPVDSTRPTRTPRRRPTSVLIRRPKLNRTVLASRSS
jgi:hypothetical protein